MATIERQDVMIPVTQLRKHVTTLRKLRPRNVEGWGDSILVANGELIGGFPMETHARIAIHNRTEPFAVPYDVLASALKGAKGDAILAPGTITTSTGRFGWVAESALAEAMMRDANDAMIDPDDHTARHVGTWDAHTFRDAVNIAVMHASKDASRPVLTGVCITELGAWYATDSYRLVIMHPSLLSDSDAESPVTIDRQAMMTAERLVSTYPVMIATYGKRGDTFAQIDTGNACRVISRMPVGQYPDCGKLVPDEAQNALALSDDATDTLVRFLRAVGKSDNPVRLTFASSGATQDRSALDLTVESDSARVSVRLDEYPGDTDGEVTFGMNAPFLADCLDSMPQGGTIIRFIAPLRPIVIVPADRSQNDYGVTAVCMPMRIA